MSPKKPVFPKDDDGLRRVFVHYAQTAPLADQIKWGIKAHRGAKLPAGRSSPNKKTAKLEASFDKLVKLVKVAPGTQSIESVRRKRMPRMPKSTFARHWAAAEARSKK